MIRVSGSKVQRIKHEVTTLPLIKQRRNILCQVLVTEH